MRKVKMLINIGSHKIGDVVYLYSFGDIQKLYDKGKLLGGELSYCETHFKDENCVGFIVAEKDEEGVMTFYYMESDEVKTVFSSISDLETGDVVELRNGEMFIFINKSVGFLNLEEGAAYNRFSNFNSDLTSYFNVRDEDIVKVYRLSPDKVVKGDIRKYFVEESEIVFNGKLGYITLGKAATTGRRFRHKDCIEFFADTHKALYDACEVTGRDMYDILHSEEFEIEEEIKI